MRCLKKGKGMMVVSLNHLKKPEVPDGLVTDMRDESVVPDVLFHFK